MIPEGEAREAMRLSGPVDTTSPTFGSGYVAGYYAAIDDMTREIRRAIGDSARTPLGIVDALQAVRDVLNDYNGPEDVSA